MSEMSTGGGGGGNVWTRKIGPMPMWGWAAIVLMLALFYYLYKKNKAGASSGAGSSASTVNTPGGVDASLVPQFVNQVYTQDQPPAAPNVTVNNTVPTPQTVIVPPATPGPGNQHVPTPSKEPTTISSSPGAYTTNVGAGGKFDEWTSTGKYSLNTIAKSHGMTAQQLISVSQSQENNTGLAAYVKGKNYNKPVPSGVHLYFPSQNWKLV